MAYTANGLSISGFLGVLVAQSGIVCLITAGAWGTPPAPSPPPPSVVLPACRPCPPTGYPLLAVIGLCLLSVLAGVRLAGVGAFTIGYLTPGFLGFAAGSVVGRTRHRQIEPYRQEPGDSDLD